MTRPRSPPCLELPIDDHLADDHHQNPCVAQKATSLALNAARLSASSASVFQAGVLKRPLHQKPLPFRIPRHQTRRSDRPSRFPLGASRRISAEFPPGWFQQSQCRGRESLRLRAWPKGGQPSPDLRQRASLACLEPTGNREVCNQGIQEMHHAGATLKPPLCSDNVAQ